MLAHQEVPLIAVVIVDLWIKIFNQTNPYRLTGLQKGVLDNISTSHHTQMKIIIIDVITLREDSYERGEDRDIRIRDCRCRSS